MTACGNSGPLELVLVDQHGDVGSAIAQQFSGLCRADEIAGSGKRPGLLHTDSLALNVNQVADQLQAGPTALASFQSLMLTSSSTTAMDLACMNWRCKSGTSSSFKTSANTAD